MNNEELKAQASKTAPQIKIAAGLWVVGMMTIMAITITWVVISLAWAGDYYALSKSVRDAAGAGSGVLATLANIQTTKAWVLPLEVLGLATFLFGFGFAFSNILQNVRLRGNTMAAVLPELKARRGPTA
ncbi:MAG: hypothetical protein BZY88_09735 [SAR202 cluster bacterium Io17-Chloro-G9]|nr:MAG: hypothetical protein BZY88_09735 [SAR202 cluster bacterium Io17-Chloro-G9]